MWVKLGVENVKKSFKDYGIYFITLALGIGIFYAFNTVDEQGAMKLMAQSDKSYVELMMELMKYLSVLVAFILGALIVYANNFIVKRRKKEFAIYTLLGMSRVNKSKILIIEQGIIGIIALVVGLILGIIFSQGLSILTMNLFDMKLDNYAFIISKSAILKTAIYYIIMFVILILFNNIVISKYKLIDLLYAKNKNERFKGRNGILSVIALIVSIIILIIAYDKIIKNGLNFHKREFSESIILGIIGTYLFFYGGLHGIIIFIKKINVVYFKSINIFTIKQIENKIKTNFLVMGTVSLLLFLTMSVLSVAIGFKSQGFEKYLPFDGTIQIYGSTTYPLGSKIYEIKNKNVDFVKWNKIYGNSLGEVLDVPYSKEDYSSPYMNSVGYMKESDYNKIQKLKGGKSVDNIKNNEALIVTQSGELKEIIKKEIFEKNKNLTVNKEKFKVKNNRVEDEAIENVNGMSELFMVFNDKTYDKLNLKFKERREIININYKNEEGKEFLNNYMSNVENKGIGFGNLKEHIVLSDKLMTTVALFVALYLGSVMLITSASILALKSLSEISDNSERYESLKRIGTSKGVIKTSIFKEISAQFLAPLSLAIVNSIVGIYVCSKFIEENGKDNIFIYGMGVLVLVTCMYIIYMILTYIISKRIVK